ncbi:MAG: hypothetical protein QM784_05075 [Polyangiaceae bacterium]
MQPHCEVCASFKRKEDLVGMRTVEVAYAERTVQLCTGHAKIAENSGVETFAELRELYGSGRRSYVPRRRPESLQPDGVSRRGGRRATDG